MEVFGNVGGKSLKDHKLGLITSERESDKNRKEKSKIFIFIKNMTVKNVV